MRWRIGAFAEHVEDDAAALGGKSRVVDVDVDGAQSVAQDAGIERQGFGFSVSGERRVLPCGDLPFFAAGVLAGIVPAGFGVIDRNGAKAGVPELGAKRGYIINGS